MVYYTDSCEWRVVYNYYFDLQDIVNFRVNIVNWLKNFLLDEKKI